MAASAVTAAKGGSSDPKLSIGQVLQRLAAEFPELTSSKLRFFEEKGLLHPARSPSGYRKYSLDDVERIRRILTMQRDRYLPLKVIGEYLDAVDRGLRPELPGAEQRPASIFAVVAGSLDRAELLRHAGAAPALLEQAVAAGLVGAGPRFSAEEGAMLRALVELERSGIGPRHLRSFRAAAQHEAGLIEQAVPPRQQRETNAQREAALALAELLTTVRRLLLQQAAKGALGDGGAPGMPEGRR